MTDLDLMVMGALVSFLSAAGAYVAIRRRANETPVPSYVQRENLTAPRPVASPGVNLSQS